MQCALEEFCFEYRIHVSLIVSTSTLYNYTLPVTSTTTIPLASLECNLTVARQWNPGIYSFNGST